MRRALWLCVIGVSLWPAVAAAGQASGPLPASLRTRLQNAQFSIVTSVRGLPLTVRERLQTMWNTSTLDIAEPGEEFRKTGASSGSKLPLRRLVAAGCTADNYCLVYYERGGTPSTWHVALFHWTPKEPRFEWGSTAFGGLKTIDEVRKAILSGVIKGDVGPW